MVSVKQYYYIESTNKKIGLIVTLNNLSLGPMPLVWCNAGLYGIICSEKVENMVGMLRDQKNSPIINVNNLTGIFYWDEVQELDQKIGKLLVN